MAQDNSNDRKNEDTEKLRAEAATMLQQARNQLADIQRALSSLGDDSAAHGRLSAAADRLSAIVSQLSQAVNSRNFPLRGMDLAAIASAVQSGEAHAALGEALTPSGATTTPAANVTSAAAETRSETESLARDVFDRHVFDPYLRYSSAEDEEESRKRQADDKKYIAQQLARHTPEGDLNASGGMIDSMLDLHVHGAGNSPQFMPRWNALTETIQRQRTAMRTAGQSTAEYDRNLDVSLHRFLKEEGRLSDAEIEKRLKGAADPLDVVKPFMRNDRASRRIENKIGIEAAHKTLSLTADASPEAKVLDAPAHPELAAISAKLKAAGVRLAVHAEAEPAHGVNVEKVAAKDGATLGT